MTLAVSGITMIRTLAVVALAGCSATPRERTPAIPATLAITHVDVVPIESAGTLRDQTVLVRGDAIVAVGPAASMTVAQGTPTLDGTGRVLIPGLIDTHIHLGNEPPEHVILYVANGVTTVQNMSGRPAHLELRKRIAAGELVGPRILSTGPTTAEERVDRPDEARAHVAMVVAAGYDAIKMYGDGADHMTEETYLALIEAAHRAKLRVVGHAPRNLPFAAVLASGQDSIDHAEEIIYTHAPLGTAPIIEMQFKEPSAEDTRRDLAQLEGLVARAEPALADLARSANTAHLALTPTLVAFETIARQVSPAFAQQLTDPGLEYVSPILRASWGPALNRYRAGSWSTRLDAMDRVLSTSLDLQKHLVRAFDRAGVPLMTGTDAPLPFVFPGRSLHRELELFVASGVSTEHALRAATIVPARALGVRAGVIAPGALADLVLLEGNPLADIRNTQRITAVVRGGRLLSRADLDTRLAALAATYDPLEPAVAAYRASATQTPELAAFVERAVNGLGYKRVGEKKLDDALQILQLNTEAFPAAFNTWDSLAEIYMMRGDKPHAIEYYERSLALEPKNTNAVRMLEKLRQAK